MFMSMKNMTLQKHWVNLPVEGLLFDRNKNKAFRISLHVEGSTESLSTFLNVLSPQIKFFLTS